MSEYYAQCLENILPEAGIEATSEQITMIAEAIEGCASVRGEMEGHHKMDAKPESPEQIEIEQLKQQRDQYWNLLQDHLCKEGECLNIENGRLVKHPAIL